MDKGIVYQGDVPKRKTHPKDSQDNGQIIDVFKLSGSRYCRAPSRIFVSGSTVVLPLETSLEEQRNYKLLISALKKLKTISELEDDWNDNGAKHFGSSLLVQCFSILSTLEEFPPEVFPVADGSIQFEYEKEDGSYLEFDIFENDVSEYRVYPDGKEIEQIVDKNKIFEEVKEFYGQPDK